LGHKKFFVSDNVTYIDFLMFELLNYMNRLTHTDRVFSNHPNLKEYQSRVEKLPRFAEFWADEQKCMRGPFCNQHAKIKI